MALVDDVEAKELMPLWPFRPAQFLKEWKACVAEAELGAVVKSPTEERHSGPSRDILLKLRSKEEVRDRGHWKTLAAVRNYEKAGRVQKVAEQVGPTTMKWGEEVRRDFHALFLAGIQEAPIGDETEKPEAFIDYHL